MKTMIIEGEFNRYSNGTWTAGVNVKEFIEVGGKRYTKVVWSDYLDTFMKEALGKQVRVAIGKIGAAHCIGAIEYDGKVEREPNKKIVGYSHLGVIGIVLAMLIAGIFAAAITGGGFVAFNLVFFPGLIGWPIIGRRMRYSAVMELLNNIEPSSQTA